jgi:hypothetical protein
MHDIISLAITTALAAHSIYFFYKWERAERRAIKAEKQVKTLERRLVARHGDHTQEALNAYREIIQYIRMTG